MKTTLPACAALLQSSRQVYMVELLTLTLRDGGATRWAASDVSIQFDGKTWEPGPIIERDSVRLSVGIEVTTSNLTLHAGPSVTVSGMPLLQAARRGLLGGAEILIEKGFTDQPGNELVGTVHIFEGRVGEVSATSTSVQCEVKSYTELLDTMVPRNVYQPSCLHVLYSAGCGVSKATNGTALSVQMGSTASLIKCGAAAGTALVLGELVFVSGANAGVRRAVKRQAAGELQLSYPLPDAPVAGDQFLVYKGCDKTMATCASKFANMARFKGQPFVPEPETAV